MLTDQAPLRALSILFALAMFACTPQGDPAIGAEGFTDDFERDQIGELWNNTGGPWTIRDGMLHVRGARNRPLWLRRVLPRNARIEFDARSDSAAGDIKVEIYGDGTSRAIAESYTATSYVIIFGGWNNSINVLAREDEHGADRIESRTKRVEAGQVYHFKIERRGQSVKVWVDDELLLEMTDPRPLVGHGHDHFAFNNWESELWFDNLEIQPL